MLPAHLSYWLMNFSDMQATVGKGLKRKKPFGTFAGDSVLLET